MTTTGGHKGPSLDQKLCQRPPTSSPRPINSSMASSRIRGCEAFFLWNPELQSSQSQTWPRTARGRLSQEVKVILTRIKAQIWTWPDTLHKMTYCTSYATETVTQHIQRFISKHRCFQLVENPVSLNTLRESGSSLIRLFWAFLPQISFSPGRLFI